MGFNASLDCYNCPARRYYLAIPTLMSLLKHEYKKTEVIFIAKQIGLLSIILNMGDGVMVYAVAVKEVRRSSVSLQVTPRVGYTGWLNKLSLMYPG